MRILQVITSLRTGGAERLVTDLSKGFRAAGDSVELLLFDGTRTPLVAELEAAGIPVHSLGTGTAAMHNPLLLFRLNRFLRRHHYDVIHAHNTPCQLLLAVASLGRSLPLFTTEHSTSNRRRKMSFLRPLERWMYGRYRQIVCVGKETREALTSHLDSLALADRMVVIPNGIDIVKYSQASPATDIIGEEGCRIAMVAAFRPQKDQQTLIRAMALLPPDFQLYLAGGYETESDKARFDDCRCLAKELGMEDRVHFLGIRDDVPALYAAADVLVLSSHHEGMPLSALEGMASGKPFVASDVQGLREVVGGAGVLVSESDVESLANAIRHIADYPEKARLIAMNCKKRAQEYDIVQTVRLYNSMYQTA